MKTAWKIVAAIDGAILLVTFCLMAWLNSRTDYGLSALEGAGQFAVCYVLFQIALAVLVILGVAALAVYIRRRRK